MQMWYDNHRHFVNALCLVSGREYFLFKWIQEGIDYIWKKLDLKNWGCARRS